jgi:hypothetical protein
MSTHATATFEVKNWDEKPYKELDGGAKFTRASVSNAYQGDIEGESTIEYLMFYQGDGPTTFVGLEHVVGRVGGRAGSFVLQHSGADDGRAAKATYFVIPGSGTGDLHGLRGKGKATLSRQAQSYPITLDYDFEE